MSDGARVLGLAEVVDHFKLNSEETGWPGNKTGATRLGFAALSLNKEGSVCRLPVAAGATQLRYA
ncbi:hypothetical protein [Streptomyces sp. HD]|uniref:hypothetical protein n=1 Tax=Streptomyces sp. HD TaxID=3020892 RepID=UPI00232E3D40|nr:hypothetical protein [Streptomyces sp. HD]MDC0768726.1 hypothetical protein [Streptomyces sp. HD]